MSRNEVYVPFPRDDYDDFVRHTTIDPVEMAVLQLWDYVERHALSDPSFFRDEEHAYEFVEKHFPEVAIEWREQDHEAAAGRRAKRNPLIWKEIEVPHGTGVRMHYGGQYHLAEVKNGKIVDDDGEYSPSEWASKIANNTTRNAWRDLWFKEALSRHWVPAQVLRDQLTEPKTLNPLPHGSAKQEEAGDGDTD